jgi:hypothetical protein
MALPPDPTHQGWVKAYGATQVTFKGLITDSAWSGNYELVLAERSSDNLRWGVVIKSDDVYPAFFRAIELNVGHQNISSPAYALENEFQLRPEMRFNTGVRAYQNDQLLYASPGLDATRKVYVHNEGSKGHTQRTEIYLSKMDMVWAEVMGFRWWWQIPYILLPCLFLLPMYRWHRKIMLLTEPDQASRAS